MFFGIAQVLFGVMRANGYVIAPLVVMVIAMYPVRLGVAFGLSGTLGADALWLSFPAGMVATAAMAGWLCRQGAWREGRVMPPSEAAKRGQYHRDCTGTNAAGTDLVPSTTWDHGGRDAAASG